MVDPVYILAAALGAAFLLPLIDRAGRWASLVVFYAVLVFMGAQAVAWLFHFASGGQEVLIFTAGFKPPFSINLKLGMMESIFLVMVNLAGLFGGLYLIKSLKEKKIYALMLFVTLVMGLDGMVLTRDLFNLFVFIEIASIALYALLAYDENSRSLSAGFKYIMAGGLASVFLLIGTIYAYRLTGTLNIDGMIESRVLLSGTAGFVALLLLFVALSIELKLFPINGWALDAYEGTHPGIGAMLSAAVASTAIMVMIKLLPLFGSLWFNVLTGVGLGTFVFSNLLGVMQDKSRRLLGYSSVGQIGLLVMVLGLSPQLGDSWKYILLTILVTHFLSKAGLFWLAGIINRDDLEGWAVLRKKPILLVLFGTFVFALLGFPPFPAFFGKWELVMSLSSSGMYILIGLILAGSFFEGVYLFRWFGYALKLKHDQEEDYTLGVEGLVSPLLFGLALYAGGYYAGTFLDATAGIDYIPLLFIIVIGLLDFLPSWAKNTLSIAGVSFYLYRMFPAYQDDHLRLIFLGIFLGGAVITLFSGYYAKGRREGFHAMALTMFAGLLMLIEAGTMLEFFYGWELMSIGSYFLLIRGEKSMPHGYSYMMFSLGGAFAMMAGFGLAYAGAGTVSMTALKDIAVYPAVAYSLMLIGFMTKTASLGLHTWLPGAHGEAVADIHFMASAILLKAGVFGIIIVLLAMGAEAEYAKVILMVLGWIGALSALIGNATALFQESAKRLLAWSSIGQLGYIIFALASMSFMGWIAALYLTVAHFLYKGILFLIIGGIALKLGTPLMYKMGGLIKRMPFSFFGVLIAIIALSGVPPLLGFAGKWMFYNIILTKQLYFQGTLVIVAGMIAFLYLFRLIDTIFLGQLKDENSRIGEISTFFLIPVYLLLMGIMFVSMFPKMVLTPLASIVGKYFPDGMLTWESTKAITQYGYFDGSMIMYTVGGIFAVVFIFLVIQVRIPVKLKQFNIVFAGESPERPETTHFAHNFFAPYKKGVGFLAEPYVDRFWSRLSEWLHSLADLIRHVYTGNGQTYAIHILIFTVVLYTVISGGF